MSKHLLPRRFKPKIGKSTYIEEKFFVKSRCYKSKTNILGTLNVYKISEKEHQVSDRWVTDEISVFKILFWKYLEYVPLIYIIANNQYAIVILKKILEKKLPP